MIRSKKIIQCLTTCIILSSLHIPANSIGYDSVIEYVDEDTKVMLQDFEKPEMKKISSQKEEKEVNLPYHPITTVWASDDSEIYSDTDENSITENKIESGEKLQVEMKNDEWARIVSTDTFIKTENISYEKVYKNLNLTRTTLEMLNFRESPSMTSKVIKKLIPGTVITVLDYDNRWAYISVDGKTGFVQRQYISDTEPKKVPLGQFEITHYCNCSICCGQYAGKGTTSTGEKVQAGKTIAVDPTVIPYGTKVLINGKVYVAQDCGSGIKGNRIDIYCETHDEALNSGKFNTQVYKINN